MAVNETGNQFVFPNRASNPADQTNLEVLQRWLNTQVVNRVTNATESKPVLGLPGTGIVEAGGISDITSIDNTVAITNAGGPTTDLSVRTLLYLSNASVNTVLPGPLTMNFTIPDFNTTDASLFITGRIGAGATLGFQFNGDSGSDYSWQSIVNNVGTLTASVDDSDTSINGILLPPLADDGVATQFTGWLPYASAVEGEEPTAAYFPHMDLEWSMYCPWNSASGKLSGQWQSTADLTSITLIQLPGGTFDFPHGSHVNLYYIYAP